MNEPRGGDGRFWATAIFALVAVTTLSLRTGTPPPRGVDAPLDEFSAARARAMLATILGSERPHPTGSDENDAVRQRVAETLAGFGYEPQIEEDFVCSASGNCAVVRNIVAERRGRIGGGAVVLNAHYDSVAAGPGAADDGAGVATLLEIARILATGDPPERSVRFVFDDGEEAGLLGAEAFVRRHPREETLAVIALEARGSSGPALMFETNRGNLNLLRAFAGSASDPATSSLFFSVYERMPNSTNFTVFKREGYAGMAIAFIGDPAQYHTPLNDLAHLSDASLQHMGSLTLSLMKEIATHGLDVSGGNASYFDLLGAYLVLWPESWNVWLAVAALFLVSIVGFAAIREERATALQVLAGLMVLIVTAMIGGAAGWMCWKLAAARAGDSFWIANAQTLVLALWLFAAATVTIPLTFVRRAPTLLSLWTTVWLLHGILGVVLSRLLPGAAYLFFMPALAAGLSGIVSMFGRRARHEGMLLVPFCVSILLVIPILSLLYDALGLPVLPGIGALSVVMLWPLFVVSAEARREALLVVAGAVGAGVCVLWFALTPVYSPDVPRAVNVVALHEPTESAIVLLVDADPVPEPFASAATWTLGPVRALQGSRSDLRFWVTPLADGDVELPDVTLTRTESDATIRLSIVPRGRDSLIRVRLPEGSALDEVALGERRVELDGPTPSFVTLHGVGSGKAVLSLRLPESGEIEIREERPGLPGPAYEIDSRRTDTEVSIGRGSRSIFVARIDLRDAEIAVDETTAKTP